MPHQACQGTDGAADGAAATVPVPLQAPRELLAARQDGSDLQRQAEKKQQRQQAQGQEQYCDGQAPQAASGSTSPSSWCWPW